MDCNMKLKSLLFLVGLFSVGMHVRAQQAPYSDYRIVENNLSTSGLLGVTQADSSISFEVEVQHIFQKIDKILSKTKTNKSQIYKVEVYLTDLKYFTQFNDLYKAYFNAPYPVRTCVGVNALVSHARIEISLEATVSP